MRALAVAVALAACGGAQGPAPAEAAPGGAELSFETADGIAIHGTYWAPDDATETACAIFVHQLSSTRAEWKPVIDRLRGRAHLYAIDMRGHGASTAGPAGKVSWKTFETADWEKVAGDVARAIDAVIGKGAGGKCVLVGASIGSTAVLLAAAGAPEHTRGVVLLSPGLAYRGIKTPDAARAVTAPVVIVHSHERGAEDAAGALAGIWRDAQVPIEVLADPGTAHGMKIVKAAPKIRDRLVEVIAAWLADG